MFKKMFGAIVKWILTFVDVSVTYDSGEVILILEFDEKIVYKKIFNVSKKK